MNRPHKPDAPVSKKVATAALPGATDPVVDAECAVTDDEPVDAICRVIEDESGLD